MKRSTIYPNAIHQLTQAGLLSPVYARSESYTIIYMNYTLAQRDGLHMLLANKHLQAPIRHTIETVLTRGLVLRISN